MSACGTGSFDTVGDGDQIDVVDFTQRVERIDEVDVGESGQILVGAAGKVHRPRGSRFRRFIRRRRLDRSTSPDPYRR